MRDSSFPSPLAAALLFIAGSLVGHFILMPWLRERDKGRQEDLQACVSSVQVLDPREGVSLDVLAARCSAGTAASLDVRALGPLGSDVLVLVCDCLAVQP